MQTIDANELVSGAFQACAGFSAPDDGAPVCAGCGWLEAEHDHGIAEVRSLPTRRAARVPKRLAS
jgi:hypothetical protein